MALPEQQEDKQQKEIKRMLDIQVAIDKALPPDIPQSARPFTIKEDVWMGELNDVEDIDEEIEELDPYSIDSQLQGDSLYDMDVDDDDIYGQIGDVIDRDEDDYLLEKTNEVERENKVIDPEAHWTPKSYSQYVKEQQGKEFEMDWTGFVENSFIRHGYEFIKQKIDDSYVPEHSIEGREIAMAEIDNKLNQLGNVNLTDYQGIREAKALWDQRYKLQFQNQMDKAMMDSEFPSVSEFVDYVQEDPEKFFKQLAQEIVNKPELIFVPQFAAARGAIAGAGVAKTMGAGVKAAQVAKYTGGALGAYGGGVTLGTLDRVAQQSTKTGEVNAAKALEQAQVDGVLGVMMVGGGKVLTKGLNTAKGVREAVRQSSELSTKASKSTEVDLQRLKEANKLDSYVRDPATETYIDGNGNVYSFEIRETQDSQVIKGEIDELTKLQDKYVNDPQALEALDVEIKAKSKELQDALNSGKEATKLIDEMKSLSDKGKDLSTSRNIAERWNQLQQRNPVVTQNFMQFDDEFGNTHLLRRLTPEVLNDGDVRIQGITGMDLTGQFNVTDSNNKLIHALKDYTVSATASLQPLTQMSPTAKLLIDTVDPRSGTKGRAPVYTIQENTAYMQGKFMVRSNELANKLNTVGKGAEEALRKHMRGVEVSDNPIVLEVAKGYRELLDEARGYAKSKGMQVDNAKDFLPRYYDRKKLKEDSAQELLANKVASIVDKDGNPKYNYDEARRSARDIALNIDKESDEAGRFIKGDQMMPVGFRKWKDVPDSDLDEFLDENFIGSIDRYLMNNARRTELDSVFGYNGKKLDDMIEQIKLETEGSGRFLEEREVKSIKDIYKLMNGTYGGQAQLKGVTDSMIAMQNILKLPLVTLTSALEPTTLLFRLNESTGVKGLVNAFGGRQARKLFGDMSAKEIDREAMEVGLVSDVAIQERIDALTGEGLEGLPAKVNNKVMKGFMLHQWTEHVRTVAYEAARNDLLKTIKGLSRDPKGKKASMRTRWLAENNIDKDLALEWYRNGADINSPVYESIKRGAARYTNTMIANPNKINKAKILSNNRSAARLFSQFKSFGSVFANEVIKTELDEVVKLWNAGNKTRAMRKAGATFGVVGAMAYWTTYKTPLLLEGKPTGEDKEIDVAAKMAQGVAGMVVPGAAMLAPLYGGRGLESGLGPMFSDLNGIVKGNNPKYIAPTYVKAYEQLNK